MAKADEKRVIRMIGPHDRPAFTKRKGTILIDVTSHSRTWTQVFSPFLLGPVPLYGEYVSQNVENAWQYSKVYPKHITEEGLVNQEYWRWARRGWENQRANRYPMGKGAIPAFSLWDGDRLGYVAAKQRIYIPLYEQAVRDSGYLRSLVQFVEDCQADGLEVGFFDFDVFDLQKERLTYDQVLNSNRKLGHAFVLARMVEKERA